jgi:hypothetical protein
MKPATEQFLISLFINWLDEVADDPAACLEGNAAAEIRMLEQVGGDLHLNIWDYWRKNHTGYEYKRLHDLRHPKDKA